MASPIRDRLEQILARRPSTFLGLGPMSRNCVDVAIEVANEQDTPILLIASRRQIECAELGGGYVEGWSTEAFARHVRVRDHGGKIVLCRDHGGPWQGQHETGPLPEAMERAKRSYRADIEAGFSIIHIDPSIDPQGDVVPADLVLSRIFELYSYCCAVAAEVGRDIIFEIGTEEQARSSGDLHEQALLLGEVTRFCRTEHLPLPMFVVLQTGTKVVEDRNEGSFPSPFRVPDELPAEIQIPAAVDMLRAHGVHLKVHNADYMDDECLSWLPRLGVAAANVAPEFGLLETRIWLRLMRERAADDLAERFLALAYASQKWRKWLAADSRANDEDRAVLAGHYVFATPAFRDIAAEAERRFRGAGVSPRAVIRAGLKAAVLRYCRQFRMIH